MRGFPAGLLVLAGLASECQVAQADDWMFRRSYYSHAATPTDAGSPRSRSAYREPFAGNHPRFAIRGGWRMNNIILNNGSSSDRTFIRENWFDMNY